MAGEIPMEYMPAALAARLDCPVDECTGTVRLTLASNAPGDVAVWQCDSAASHEWHEDGSPRWGMEFAVKVVVGDAVVGRRARGERRALRVTARLGACLSKPSGSVLRSGSLSRS